MQCPKCSYEPSMSEMQASPGQCPSCGVYYAKVSRQTEPENGHKPQSRLAGAWQGAKLSVEEGRRLREEDERNRAKARSISAASPVVVTDVQIQFGSMVTLLVKLAFAAIPAAIIVTIIIWGVVSILGLLPLLLR
jgi:hypothetical protein